MQKDTKSDKESDTKRQSINYGNASIKVWPGHPKTTLLPQSNLNTLLKQSDLNSQRRDVRLIVKHGQDVLVPPSHVILQVVPIKVVQD